MNNIQRKLIQKIKEASDFISKKAISGKGSYVVVNNDFLEKIKLHEKIEKRKRIITEIIEGRNPNPDSENKLS